jgi:hypothetical protein
MGILRDPLGHASPAAEQSHHADGITPARAVAQSSAPPSASLRDDGRSELRSRRDALAEQVAEMHWDLGGLAYEMAIRDHFRLDVLVRRAAMLQDRDAELAEVERLLRMDQDGVAGACPNCQAPHSRGALYCWQCGMTLMESRLSSAGQQDGATSVMDALLAQETSPAAEPAAGPDE